jgi:hypothetical protein
MRTELPVEPLPRTVNFILYKKDILTGTITQILFSNYSDRPVFLLKNLVRSRLIFLVSSFALSICFRSSNFGRNTPPTARVISEFGTKFPNLAVSQFVQPETTEAFPRATALKAASTTASEVCIPFFIKASLTFVPMFAASKKFVSVGPGHSAVTVDVERTIFFGNGFAE